MSSDQETPNDPVPVLPFQLPLSVPFVLLGAGMLVGRWLSNPPSTMPQDWEYYSFYTSAYEMMLVLGVGVLLIGLVNTIHIGYALYQNPGDPDGI